MITSERGTVEFDYNVCNSGRQFIQTLIRYLVAGREPLYRLDTRIEFGCIFICILEIKKNMYEMEKYFYCMFLGFTFENIFTFHVIIKV